MTPTDIATITKVMGSVIREFTAKAVTDEMAPLLARNAALELRILALETHPAPVAVGPVGLSGQKGETGAGIASLVVSAEGRLLAHLTDGRSLDAGPVPPGQKGATGERGDRGENGTNGQDAPPLDMDAVVMRVLALVPPPASGADGKDGTMGPAGRDGLDGKDGAPGRAGSQISIGKGAPTTGGNHGDLYIDLSSGEIHQWSSA